MNTETLSSIQPVGISGSGTWFLVGFVSLVIATACFAGLAPITLSVAAVFLFAGPHNWMEARYILGRLPARTGRLFPFFLASFVGIVGLTVAFWLIPSSLRLAGDSLDYSTLYAVWNSLFLLWIATLIQMRSRTNPRFDAGWVWPVAFLLIAGVWLEPFALSVLLVYLHPCVAFILLDRELKRSHREWRLAYWFVLPVIPLGWLFVCWQSYQAPAMAGDDPITMALMAHAGDWFLTDIPPRLLVATHAYFEMIHYGIWIVLIPLLGLRSVPWSLKTIPVARRSVSWQSAITTFLLMGLLIVFVLWACFLVDYSTTRTIYFLVAMLHVLAEIPFLLRML